MGRIVIVRHASPDAYKFGMRHGAQGGALPPLFTAITGHTAPLDTGTDLEGINLSLGPQGVVMTQILGKLLAEDGTEPTLNISSRYLRALETMAHTMNAINPEQMESAEPMVLENVSPGGPVQPYLDALIASGTGHQSALLTSHDSHPGELVHLLLYGKADEQVSAEFIEKHKFLKDVVNPFEVPTCCGYQIDFEGTLGNLPNLIGKPEAFTIKKIHPHQAMAEALSKMAEIVATGKPSYTISHDGASDTLRHCASLFSDVSLEQTIIGELFSLPGKTKTQISTTTPLILNIARAAHYTQEIAKLDDATLSRNNIPLATGEAARQLVESGTLDRLLEYTEIKSLSPDDIKRSVSTFVASAHSGPK